MGHPPFGHLQQPSMGYVRSLFHERRVSTEASGSLGFAMLWKLEVKLDYRDGMVDFEYDPKREPKFVR